MTHLLPILSPLAVASPVAFATPITQRAGLSPADCENQTCDEFRDVDQTKYNHCMYNCALTEALRQNPEHYWYSSEGTECQYGCGLKIGHGDDIEIASLGESGNGENVHNTGDTIFNLEQFVPASLYSACATSGDNGACSGGDGTTWMSWTTRYGEWDDGEKSYWNEITPDPQPAWNSQTDFGISNSVRERSVDDEGQSYGSLKLTAHIKLDSLYSAEIIDKLRTAVMDIYKGVKDDDPSQKVITDKTLQLVEFDQNTVRYKVIQSNVSPAIVTQRAPQSITVALVRRDQSEVATFRYKLTVCDPKTYPNPCGWLAAILGITSTATGLVPVAGEVSKVAGLMGSVVTAGCLANGDQEWANKEIPKCSD